MDKIRILVIPKNKEHKNMQRIVYPHLYLQEKYEDKFFVDIVLEPELDDDEYLKQYDLIIYHEYLDEDGSIVERFKKLGIKSILDITDNWSIKKNSPIYKYVKHQEDVVKNTIRNAEHITTSTQKMYNKIKTLVPEDRITIIHDSINMEDAQYHKKTQPSNRVRLGWVGNDYSLGDIDILKGLVSKLKSDKLLDKVQFVLCGFDLDSYYSKTNEVNGKSEQVKHKPTDTVWYKYEKILTDNYDSVSEDYRKYLLEFKEGGYGDVKNEPYRRVWKKPDRKYGEHYSEFDVTLIPKHVNPYNETSSPFSMVESGIYKKPVIAQDFGAHQEDLTNAYIKGGEIDITANSLLVNPRNNHKEWHKYIKKLINNQELIPKLGENLYNTIKNKYDINTNIELKRKLYENLIMK